ncbi:MAG: hypothetical protein WDN25_10855 [Acetobacteraceae bacterium]
MGLLFFYLLIAGYELERLRADGIRLARFAALVLPVVLPAGLYMLSPLAPLAEGTEFLSIAGKASELVFPFANYLLPLDIATASAVVAFLVLCFAKRCCRVTCGGVVTLTLTALLFSRRRGVQGHLPPRYALRHHAGIPAVRRIPADRPAEARRTRRRRRVRHAVQRPHVAVVLFAWHGHRQDLADLRATIAQVEPGASVLAVSVTPDEAPEYWRHAPLSRKLSTGFQLDQHLSALLVIERRAYWPFLFDNPSQQPVETLPHYQRLAEQANGIAGHNALVAPRQVDLCGYHYVLLLDAAGEPDLARFAADRLALVARSGIAALFRIRPGSCAS